MYQIASKGNFHELFIGKKLGQEFDGWTVFAEFTRREDAEDYLEYCRWRVRAIKHLR